MRIKIREPNKCQHQQSQADVDCFLSNSPSPFFIHKIFLPAVLSRAALRLAQRARCNQGYNDQTVATTALTAPAHAPITVIWQTGNGFTLVRICEGTLHTADDFPIIGVAAPIGGSGVGPQPASAPEERGQTLPVAALAVPGNRPAAEPAR